MQTFKEFLILTERQNTHSADINELYLGYYLGGGSWNIFDNPKEAEEKVKEKRSLITPQDFDLRTSQAKNMATAALDWAKKNRFNGRVRKVYWTARAGSLQKAVGNSGTVDNGNPTDILIEFSDGQFLGISAKSTKNNSEIGFKNPGMGTIEKRFNIDLRSIKEPAEALFIKRHNLPEIASKRKLLIRADNKLQSEADKEGSVIIGMLRDRLLTTLQKLTDAKATEYIINDLLDAGKAIYPHYIKVTGKQGSVSVMDPLENDKLALVKRKKITFHPVGDGGIGIMAGEKKIMNLRFKYSSQKMASSMKLSGQPW